MPPPLGANSATLLVLSYLIILTWEVRSLGMGVADGLLSPCETHIRPVARWYREFAKDPVVRRIGFVQTLGSHPKIRLARITRVNQCRWSILFWELPYSSVEHGQHTCGSSLSPTDQCMMIRYRDYSASYFVGWEFTSQKNVMSDLLYVKGCCVNMRVFPTSSKLLGYFSLLCSFADWPGRAQIVQLSQVINRQ